MFISHYNGHEIKLVRPLSTVDNTRDYAHVSTVDSGLTITNQIYSSLSPCDNCAITMFLHTGKIR